MKRPPPPLPAPANFHGWKVTPIRDDIAWMKPGPDAPFNAINPDPTSTMFPGANSSPKAVKMVSRDTIYTKVACTPDLDVWWESRDPFAD